MTKFLNISTDNTLGGNSPSDVAVSSQKAVKEYVDSHGGGGSTAIDNLSITKNSSNEIQTVGVINSRDSSTAIKTWTGTKAQYDAIVTKDANTLYNVIDSIPVEEELQLSNPFSLLDYKFSEYEISNASWLRSNGQYNSGTTYADVYNLLLQIKNGTVTKAGVSVKLSTETYADTDFVLNTSDTTFRLPLKVALASGKAVAGNGMTLGLANPSHNTGLWYNSGVYLNDNVYGQDIGYTAGSATNIGRGGVGITTDPTKSGIETSANGLYLYFYVGAVIQDASVIAAASVLTQIANLSFDYVVESKAPTANDPSWYRVYKSGWVEQGGQVTGTTNITITVNFSKTMYDTNYYIGACGCNTGRSDYADALVGFMPDTKTTTSVGLNARYWSTNTTAIITWEVKGQGA